MYLRHIAVTLVCAGLIGGPIDAGAQVVVAPREQREHLTVGGTLGVYPMGGSQSASRQSFEYHGVHWDAVRLGFSQRIARYFVMDFVVHLGFSFLPEPGYEQFGGTSFGEPDPNVINRSRWGWHWGFGIGPYYHHPAGFTAGVATEISFAKGAAVDTAFFRVVPALGWRWSEPLDDWFLHARWVFGWTILHGLEELNTFPLSSLPITGIQVTYGF